MRFFYPSFALGVALIAATSGGALLAQDQPAAGSPPPAAASQASPASTSPVASPNAQPQRAPDPQRQVRMLTRRLALTPDQQSQIETILVARRQEIESVRTDPTLAPKVKRVTVRSIFQVSDNKIKSLLNDTQKQLYEQMKQDRKARMRQGRAPLNGQNSNQN